MRRKWKRKGEKAWGEAAGEERDRAGEGGRLAKLFFFSDISNCCDASEGKLINCFWLFIYLKRTKCAGRELHRGRSQTVLIWSQPVGRQLQSQHIRLKKKKFTYLTFKTRYKSSLIHQAAHITRRGSIFGLESTYRTTLGTRVLWWLFGFARTMTSLWFLKDPLWNKGCRSPRLNKEMMASNNPNCSTTTSNGLINLWHL